MNKFLSDETCLHKAGKNAGDYVRNNAGALEKIMNTVSL
jgi:3-deoxy-D-manno-octulosonic-acid transferase